MGKTVAEKIIKTHLVDGKMTKGSEIGIKMDQTLTHDVTGTLAYLAFESMKIPKVKTEFSISYVDHNLLQVDYKNMDDHLFLKSTAEKFGVHYSKAGNGICHSVHYQRYAVPGKTLIGSDSHTTTTGGLGVLAIGAGGMDVAMAMAGEAFHLTMPFITNVVLTGELKPGVAPKDIILELLRRLSVKGGLGKIMEYTGEGIKSLRVPDRATITNMGAELGATTSIFPSDEMTRKFLKAQGREEDWTEILPDENAVYDEVIEIDLNELEPMIAKPDMPDNVVPVKECSHVKVDQVYIGSCTNASYSDIKKAAVMLRDKTVHPDVSFILSAGTRQTFQELIRDGVIQSLVTSGARIMEPGCGACVGIGQAPNSGGVSVRTSNRNFKGRSGTMDAHVYLASPEVAAAAALTGYIEDPRRVFNSRELAAFVEPTKYLVDDSQVIKPKNKHTDEVEILRGPNIKPLPINEGITETLKAHVVSKLGDNMTTDDIIPAGSIFSSLRSNVPEISKITFGRIDPNFVERTQQYKKSIIVGGENYGQGSSREHAAIAPMYLGVKAILAKSIARIHKANLINFGILPLIFRDKKDYEYIARDDELEVVQIINQIKNKKISIRNNTQNLIIETVLDISDREAELLIAGGRLNYVKQKNQIN
ncbi:aconitate hydratase [Tindallia californiensis]|uniref:Aconitase n=1 Tax=Tindallia californiensis TaxID=159292 RepID=A0A1H3QAG2_9FIRM|nr:aconitate hydratase [Tindallia californiensis]SDZ09689.1 aconitase [Tindallia californiensis]